MERQSRLGWRSAVKRLRQRERRPCVNARIALATGPFHRLCPQEMGNGENLSPEPETFRTKPGLSPNDLLPSSIHVAPHRWLLRTNAWCRCVGTPGLGVVSHGL